MKKSNKAVATREYIGDVMNGRRDRIPLRHQPDPALPLELWVQDKNDDEPTCLLRIVDCHDDGEGWTVTVRPWIYEEPPKLLPRSLRPPTWATDEHGYTPLPAFALPGEPEAVDEWTQDQLTIAAIGRDAQRKRRQSLAAQRDRALLSVLERIDLARTAAARNGISVHSELKAVRRMHERGRSDGLVNAELERVERIAYRDAA